MAAILAGLRADARPMPMSQVVRAVEHAFGLGWKKAFRRFSITSMAAVSIGQAHAAITHGEPQRALKIQHPGIRQSIDRAVDNFATLLRTSCLVPEEPATGSLNCLALHRLSCA